MSYSFTTRGAGKAGASAAVAAELDKVVAAQEIHAKDRDQVLEAANGFIGILREDDTQDIQVTASGSLWWDKDTGINSASVTISVSLAPRVEAG